MQALGEFLSLAGKFYYFLRTPSQVLEGSPKEA